MGNYGIKVSLPGYNIDDADPKHYSFHSKYAGVKCFLQGSGQAVIPQGSSGVTVEITHNLGFAPMYLVYSNLGNDGKYYLNRVRIDGDTTQYVDDYYSWNNGVYTEQGLWSDSTVLHIEFKTTDTSVSHTIPYYYFIFGDKGGI